MQTLNTAYLKQPDIKPFEYVGVIKLGVCGPDSGLQDPGQVVEIQVAGRLGQVLPVTQVSHHSGTLHLGVLALLANKDNLTTDPY